MLETATNLLPMYPKLVILLLWLALVAPGFSQNLIVNGDFEDTPPGFLPVTGWSGFAVINGGTTPNTGSKVLLLPPGGSASQTGIPTLTGRMYLLEYFYGTPVQTPNAFWNGVALGAPLASFTSSTNALYTGVQYLVTGGAGSSTLTFQNPSGTLNSIIDTVSLVAVPELDLKGAPLACCTLLIGLLLFRSRKHGVSPI